MNSVMAIITFIGLLICFVIGFIMGRINVKPSGRLVINEGADEIFVAITDKPEDLKRHKSITLKVYVTKGEKMR